MLLREKKKSDQLLWQNPNPSENDNQETIQRRHQNFHYIGIEDWLKTNRNEIVILWVYFTIPFGFSLIHHLFGIIFNFLTISFG